MTKALKQKADKASRGAFLVQAKPALIWILMACVAFWVIYIFYPRHNDAGQVSWGYQSAEQIIADNRSLINLTLSTAPPVLQPEVVQNIARILKRASIEDDAFVHHLIVTSTKNDGQAYKQTLAHARQLNPRHKGLLRANILTAQQERNFDVIVSDATLLYRLDADNRDEYDALFTQVFAVSEGRSVIAAQAKRTPTPIWLYTLLRSQIDSATADDVVSLRGLIDDFFANSDDTRLINNLNTAYVGKLFSLHKYRAAQDFWESKKPEGVLENNSDEILFNPNFMPLDTILQFDWTLFNNKNVSTEYQGTGGGFLSFRGKSVDMLARQYFFSPQQSGVYNIMLNAEHSYDAKKGNFYLELRCASDDRLMARHDIEASLTVSQPNQISLTVDFASCEVAYMVIKAQPGVFSQPITMVVKSLRMTPA